MFLFFEFSPDRNENPAVRKAIFSCNCRATKGSSYNCFRKKVFGARSCSVVLETASKKDNKSFLRLLRL